MEIVHYLTFYISDTQYVNGAEIEVNDLEYRNKISTILYVSLKLFTYGYISKMLSTQNKSCKPEVDIEA